jgi:hypothetical protein
MAKGKPFKSRNLKHIVVECGHDAFSTDCGIMYCKMCDTKVAAEERLMAQQHIGLKKHV